MCRLGLVVVLLARFWEVLVLARLGINCRLCCHYQSLATRAQPYDIVVDKLKQYSDCTRKNDGLAAVVFDYATAVRGVISVWSYVCYNYHDMRGPDYLGLPILAGQHVGKKIMLLG